LVPQSLKEAGVPVERSASVKETVKRTANVTSVRLTVGEKADFKAGQWAFVTVAADGKEIRKPLSISSSPSETGYIEFTKKLTGSGFSRAIASLKAGDPVKIKYPFGSFTYEDRYPKIAFLSGGIGITPIRSLTRDIVDEDLGTDAVLLYGNNTADEIAFKDDLDEIEKRYAKLKVVHIIRDADKDWKGYTGLITADIVKKEVPDYQERRFYLCGPPAMVTALTKILVEGLKVDKANIVTENFAGY
jgi:ferredoxin-NADP reductase